LNKLIQQFLGGGWVVLLIGAAGMIARLVTTNDKLAVSDVVKKMLSSMIASMIAWFIMEQFEMDSMYKAIAYGLVGLNSPEIIQGVLKISGQFAADPMSFMKKEQPKPKRKR
jgi:cell shape-determining protein MreD